MTDYQRTIVAIRGDTHAGLEDGLKDPATLLPMVDLDTGLRQMDSWKPVTLRPFQERLWEWHEEARNGMAALAGNDPIVFMEMGDVTQGNYFRDNLGEASMSDQYFIAKSSFYSWMDMPQVNEVYMVSATGVHSGMTQALLPTELRIKYPGKTVKMADHWMLNVGGVNIDVAHKGPFYGKRIWLRGNEFHWYLQNILMEDVADGLTPPDVLLRAHFHTYTRAWGWHQSAKGYWECHGVITPAMSFINDYAKAATGSKSKISCGLVALEIINGKLHKIHDWVHWIDLRTIEVVK